MQSKQKFLEKFGRRISELRKQKGITQESLAESIDVHRTYIGFIEQGKRNPTIDNIRRIAEALDVSLIDLFRSL